MKKRILALAIAVAMTAISLSACSGGSSNTSPTSGDSSTGETVAPNANAEGQTIAEGQRIGAEGDAVDGGTLIVSMPSSPLSMDPSQYSTLYEYNIMYNVMETLFIYDENYSGLLPNIATDWVVSEDGLSYTINLRDDVYFQKGKYQDGRKMTAEDVKYSLERSKAVSATDRICRDFFDYVEVVSDTQVILHMVQPAGPLIMQLAEIGNAIVPKEEVEGWGDEWGINIIGTGPFMLKSVVTDESVALVKNDNYWGVQPHVDGITFKIISDSNQAINAVTTGEVDIAMYIQGEAIQRAKDSNLLMQTPSSSITYIRFNEVNGPTANADVRKALTMAVDIDALVQGVYQYGEGSRAYQPLTAYSWGYEAKHNDLVPAYDPEAAKALLAEAGYPNGFTMTLYIGSTTYRERMAQMLQYYWGEIGVTLNIKSSTMAEWTSSVVKSWESDVVNSYGVSWNANPDPYGFIHRFFSSGTIDASSNAGGHNDPALDEKLNLAFGSTDQDYRKALYSEIMEQVMQEYTGIYYAYEARNWAISPRVHDAVLRADTQMLVATPFNNIWLEP